MSRRMRLPSKELGEIEVLAIWERDGAWEGEWAPLQGTPIGSLLSVVSQDVLDQALLGYSTPLALAIGLPPKGALAKLPVPARTCAKRRTCPLYVEKFCFPTTKAALSHCYEPGGVADAKERAAAAMAISLWHEGVYLIVVKEGHA